MIFKNYLFALIMLLMSNIAYGCVVQEITYYTYQSKKELISLYHVHKNIYESRKRLDAVGVRSDRRGTECHYDAYTKALMVLKKDHGISENSPELKQ